MHMRISNRIRRKANRVMYRRERGCAFHRYMTGRLRIVSGRGFVKRHMRF